MKRLSWKHCALVAAIAAACAWATPALIRAEDGPIAEWKAPARAARKKNPTAADEKSVAAGKVVYTQQCLSCHGNAGKGDGTAAKDLNPRPRDLSDPKIQAESDGELFWKISTGRKPMPEFEKLINEDERWNVINYVRGFGPKAGGGQ